MLAAAKTPQEFQKILDEGSSSFYLIATDSRHQIFCSKKIDPISFKSTIQDTQLLMDYRSDKLKTDHVGGIK